MFTETVRNCKGVFELVLADFPGLTATPTATPGPIYAQWARRRLILLILSALFPMGLCRTSGGVPSLTSTAGHGVLTTARLNHCQTPSTQTSHRSDRGGDGTFEIAVETSSTGVIE